MDHSPPGSSVQFTARTLPWIAMPSSRAFPDPGIEPSSLTSPALAGGFFTTSTTWEAPFLPPRVMLPPQIYHHSLPEDITAISLPTGGRTAVFSQGPPTLPRWHLFFFPFQQYKCNLRHTTEAAPTKSVLVDLTVSLFANCKHGLKLLLPPSWSLRVLGLSDSKFPITGRRGWRVVLSSCSSAKSLWPETALCMKESKFPPELKINVFWGKS